MSRAIFGLFVASVRPGERDHRVAAPVGEPRIARDHSVAAAAFDDELIGGQDKLPRRRVFLSARRR